MPCNLSKGESMNCRITGTGVVLIMLFLAPCCRGQSGDSASATDEAHGEIGVSPLPDSVLRTRSRGSHFDTTAAFMTSGPFNGYPFSRIYLPHSDTLRLSVSDINKTVVYKEGGRNLYAGWFEIRVNPELILPKSSIYFLQATFCDSTFKRRFIYLK